jgi:hypothetical protein
MEEYSIHYLRIFFLEDTVADSDTAEATNTIPQTNGQKHKGKKAGKRSASPSSGSFTKLDIPELKENVGQRAAGSINELVLLVGPCLNAAGIR